ncbi:MAG: cyclophilin family peptidyl-prolyl cis-trans isomerase [Verrucomicrobiales bacterium]|jgi:cyclophilin family peptidyl-prolyl cis-trans isomerase
MHRKISQIFSLAALLTLTGCFGGGDDSTEIAPRYGRADRMAYDTVHMQVEFNRELHTIVIDLKPGAAPKTVANFKKNIASGFYRGLNFHRVIDDYIVQTGDPLSRKMSRKADWGTGGPNYTVPAEIGLKHTRGALATARLGDGENPSKESSGSQFYICLKDLPHLDSGYTVFGYVREGPGLKVLDQMSRVPADINDIPIKPITVRAIGLTRPDAPAGKSRPTDTPKPKRVPKPGEEQDKARTKLIKKFW